MQFRVALALFATAVMAQDLSGAPACSRSCFLDSFPVSGCSDQTDFACICASSDYIDTVTFCVLGACSADDVVKTLTWAQDTCAAAGVPI